MRPIIRLTARNAAAVLASDVVNRATTFLLYALVARYLGIFQFGQLSLALTLFCTFQVVSVAGLKLLIAREVAKDRTRTGTFAVTGSLVVIAASILSFGLLAVFVRLVQYSPSTKSVILLLGLALLPFSLSAVCEAVFLGWERMHFIAYANLPMNTVKIAVAFLMLHEGYDLYALMILAVVAQTAVVIVEWLLLLRFTIRLHIRADVPFALALIKSATPFLGMDAIIALMASVNIVLLSRMVGERETGLYNAATQVLVPVTLLCQSIVLSVFPALCKRFEPSFRQARLISERLLALLLAITLPATVGLLFLSNSVLVFLYGNKGFQSAGMAVRVMAGTIILTAITSVLGQVLVAAGRERLTLRIVSIDLLVNFSVGIILIREFGLIGAALSMLLTKILDAAQHWMLTYSLFSKPPIARLLWKPIVASACMGGYLLLIQDQRVLTAVVSAGALYAVAFLALAVLSTRAWFGFRKTRSGISGI